MPKEYENLGLPLGRMMTSEILESVGKHRHFYLTTLVKADRITEYLKKNSGHAMPMPLMAVLLKGLAMTVREHPAARTLFYSPPPRMVRFEHCTATVPIEREVNGERIVFFGNLKDCDTRTLQDIAAELDMLKTASIREITDFEMWLKLARLPKWLRKLAFIPIQRIPYVRAVGSGVFGVAEAGAEGVDDFLPVAGATVTFAVGSLAERPVAENGMVVARMTLPLTVMFDQRAIDGSLAARFFEACVKRLESPDFL